MRSEQTAVVHRFNSQVSFSTETMPHTIYLSEGMARLVAHELIKAADDIRKTPEYHRSGYTGDTITQE